MMIVMPMESCDGILRVVDIIISYDDCECLWSLVNGYGGLLSIINSYDDCECLCSLVNGYGRLLSIINSYFLVPTHVIDYVQLFMIVKRYEWLWMIIGTCHWL